MRIIQNESHRCEGLLAGTLGCEVKDHVEDEGIGNSNKDHIRALTGMAQWSTVLQTERLLVRFPVRAHA